MNPSCITIDNVGKAYKQYPSKIARLIEWISPSSKKRHKLHWVLKDISVSIHQGEALGIIGVNGAGKSTLLKIITGTTRPTTGSIDISGKVAAILELGMGFHPEFTGRQNVYISGQLMGLSKEELDRLMPEIEAFAEIDDYIDQPIRVYSTGMQMRLAFSVATAVRPDILIIDEALSVGDAYFQHKSFDRIRQFKNNGVSIIFVSHSMNDVRVLCDRVILLNQGTLVKDGQADEVVDYYNAIIAQKENEGLRVSQQREKTGWLVTKSGTGEATIKSLGLFDRHSNKELAIAQVGQAVELQLEAFAHKDLPQLVLGCKIQDKQGHIVWGTNTWHTQQILRNIKAGEKIVFYLPFTCNLGPGSYSVTPALVSSDSHLTNNYEWTDNMLIFDVLNVDKQFFVGSNYLDARFSISREFEVTIA